jgi:hypothetical protein
MQSQGPTKQDAKIFLKRLQSLGAYNGGLRQIEDIIKEMEEDHGIPRKRCLFLLSKWSDSRYWYEYGSLLEGGWLTDKGMAVEVSIAI